MDCKFAMHLADANKELDQWRKVAGLFRSLQLVVWLPVSFSSSQTRFGSVLGRIACIAQMRYVARSLVCLCVGLFALIIPVGHAKTAELIEMPFGRELGRPVIGGPKIRYHVSNHDT